MKESWKRFPDRELNKGNYGAVIVRTENKDPFTAFMRFILFVVIFQSSKLERVRKGTHTKTRWNRARDVSDPLIRLILLPFLSWYSNVSFVEDGGPKRSTRDPSPATFFSPPSPPLKIATLNGNQEPNTFILSILHYWSGVEWSRVYSSLSCTYLTTLNGLPLRLFWYKQVEVYKFELPPASSVR